MITNNTAYNSTYKKLAVQLLNEALCFVSSSVLADSFVLRNRQLLIAAKRWQKPFKKRKIRSPDSADLQSVQVNKKSSS